MLCEIVLEVCEKSSVDGALIGDQLWCFRHGFILCGLGGGEKQHTHRGDQAQRQAGGNKKNR